LCDAAARIWNFSLQYQRTVNRDNTVSIQNLRLQIEPVRCRATLAGCTVTVQQHLDGTFTITHGPQRLGRYSAQGAPLETQRIAARKAVEKTHRFGGYGSLTKTGHFTCYENRTF
jgi:hypothetical protein